ncbi:hypothetical protein EON77_14920 [bacterium]|nr:MAG: hypothetical protein EON77_14920 [bacterium]
MNETIPPNHPATADEPRAEYVAMAQTSFARIVGIAEEIAWDHPAGSGPDALDVPEEVGRLIHALWNRLAVADGVLTRAERLTLDRVVSGHPRYADVVAKLDGHDAGDVGGYALLRVAAERPVAREQLLVELETFGYALAAVDRSFDHAELDALHAFLAEVVA